MHTQQRRWILSALSVGTAVMMFASPVAWADDGEGGGHGGRDRGRDNGNATVQVVNQHEGDDENENNNNVNAANREAALTNALVAAINNQGTTLPNLRLDDEDGVATLEVDQVRVTTLANLVSNLTAADATTVSNAVNSNSGTVQTFLNNGTATANAVKQALTSSGVTATVLAIVMGREDQLIVVTA